MDSPPREANSASPLTRLRRRARWMGRELQGRVRSPLAKDHQEEGSMNLELDGDSRTLLIAFGGMRGARIGVPAFEFSMASSELPVKRLFVRDLRQAWYHLGTPEYGPTLNSVAEGLRGLLAQHEVERLVVTGNSAGGYAALVFGTLLGADTVLCFAPQTVLDLDTLAEMDDHRWDEQVKAVIAADSLDERWVDLRAALPRARHADTRYQVYFDDTLSVDRLHAERLREVPDMHLYRFGKGAHNLVRALRQAGALERLLRQALGVPPAAPQAER